MITVLVIGIGSSSPAHLTAEAVTALNRVDVFLVADKRAKTDDPVARDLAALRGELCRAVITHDDYRVIEVVDPPPIGRRPATARPLRTGTPAARSPTAR